MIGCKKTQDVAIQDQSTRIIEFYFKKLLNLATLASPTVIGSYTVTLASGHNFTNGEYISILEGQNVFQCQVLNVNTNILTLDSPLDYVFSVLAEVRRTITNMNVNGSSTPVIFNIVPSANMKWHINGIVIQIIDNVAMDDSTFGGIVALTRGVLLRHKNHEIYNIGNFKNNGDFNLKNWDVKYSDKAPSGSYGLTVKKIFNDQENSGVVIFINGELLDELQIIIQDDLSALTSMYAYCFGHQVKD